LTSFDILRALPAGFGWVARRMLTNADSLQKNTALPALAPCRGRVERRSKAKESQQKPRSRLGFSRRHLGFPWLWRRRKAKKSQPKPTKAKG